MKTTAFNKFAEEKAINHSTIWTNVITGNNPIAVDPSEYGVKMESFRAQARAEGFRTKLFSSEEVLIYRENCI